MRLISIIIVLLTIIHNTSFSQGSAFGFQEATITKKDGSSITCYVEVAVTYTSNVAYKLTQDSKALSLKSSEIKTIQTPYKFVENITLDNKERLMSVVVDGKVKLFSHVTVNPGTPQQSGGGTYAKNGPPTIIYALKKDDEYIEVRKKGFKVPLSEALADQPTILERINSKEFKFEDTETIVKEYNEFYKHPPRQLTVKVIDAETKKPIKDVKVTIKETDKTTLTNFLGFFQITIDVIDVLKLESPGYKDAEIKVPDVDTFQVSLEKKPVTN